MAITDFDSLKTSVADFLNRDDLTSVIPTFIQLAESQLERALRVRDMIERSTAEIDSQFSALPADFLEAKSFRITSTTPDTPVEYITISEMDRKDQENSSPGKPIYYTIEGSELRVHPIPDSTYDIELAYYEQIPALSDSNTTNWLLTKHPDVYLYSTLVQSAPYLSEDNRINVWGTLMREGLDAVRGASDRATYGDGPLVARAKQFGA